ncbi:DUF262 domain-containing protein [Xanthomonas sp. SI]|uniref:DUF262 domain-containing protein n=1 Tax=Xanthomonas sp. SI TaxID=2724123 RepID=UPI00163A9137|nr:DUF262 domain-containing protein [Xanthomonas sp. SI]QNH14329.1 hypothetical protein HEP75_03798 [Xanthomonas sp. SI]
MHTPLNASATTAGTLMSSSTLEIPPYQREYAWQLDEVSDFWNDLKKAINEDSYFLGLLILTDDGGRKHVVDGQQRILTLTLLAGALYQEALFAGRKALAERIHADFLSSIDYDTDEVHPRVILSDGQDDVTLQALLSTGAPPLVLGDTGGSISHVMSEAYKFLKDQLRKDLADDPFKRLGAWTDFITNRLYFAVFVHPDSASAYRVFEVINTRGKELTTADLLKNYVLSQTPKTKRDELYQQWQRIARSFSLNGSNSFVQYIRHVITIEAGHVLPKDLFDFIAGRQVFGSRSPPSIPELMAILSAHLPLYLQMIDPTLEGPAESDALKIFSALNSLGVISVRPLLLAIANVPDSIEGMRYVLRLVVRRIVVGNLGTGNVERQLSEAARSVKSANDWRSAEAALRDLDPEDELFLDQLKRRSFNKGVLTFLRRSIIQNEMTPESIGVLHFIAPRQQGVWNGLSDEDLSYWGATIGNVILTELERRPKAASTWEGVKNALLPSAVDGEIVQALEAFDVWDASAIEEIGKNLSDSARQVWC